VKRPFDEAKQQTFTCLGPPVCYALQFLMSEASQEKAGELVTRVTCEALDTIAALVGYTSGAPIR
jgi:hypothetical protein